MSVLVDVVRTEGVSFYFFYLYRTPECGLSSWTGLRGGLTLPLYQYQSVLYGTVQYWGRPTIVGTELYCTTGE